MTVDITCFFYYSFFLDDLSTTDIYTLSLLDALPISSEDRAGTNRGIPCQIPEIEGSGTIHRGREHAVGDRKSTRLNSSHRCISYAVFCLKKKRTIHLVHVG